MRMWLRPVGFIVITTLLLRAQSFTGSVVGVVMDSSGAVIPRATLTVTHRETSEARTVLTTGRGEYSIPALPPGTYELKAQAPGFKQYVRDDVRVGVLQSVRIDVTLEPGSVAEVVSVTAESPLLDTTDASLGQVVDNRKIINLPLNGRNPMALVAMTTGVVPGDSSTFGGQPVLQNVYAQGNFSVNSGLQSQSESLVDGVPNNVFLWNAPAFVPSVEAIEEFKVQTNNFSAEFGHTGGGIVNITTKSGSNRFHGSAFEFLRNSALDANNFFNNRSGQNKPPFTYNQFGASIGGPVKLPGYNGTNRTFFFGDYEGFRQRSGRTILSTVPQALQRQGDFSQTRNAAGQPITIYDPLTVHANAGAGSGFVRDPFPGNRIPQDRFDPAAAKAVNLWALPNLPGTGPAQINNYVSNAALGSVQDQVNIRVDHVFSPSQRTFGRFSHNRMLPGSGDLFNTIPGARPVNPFENNTPLLIWSRNFGLDHTWVISPSAVASFRYGFTRQRQFRNPASLGIDLTTMGFSRQYNDGIQIRALPNYAPAGFDTVGEGGNVFFRRGDNVHSGQGSLTRNSTRHSLKTGFEFRAFLFNDTRAPMGSGAFNFTSAFTQADPLRASAVAGHSFASFLLGYPASGSNQFFPAVSLNQNYYGLYVQDDLRVSANLTVNLGLRWDLETPKTERYNRLSTLDPKVVSPLARETGLDLHGGLRFLGVDGVSRGQWSIHPHNFGPRFGFAYRITPRFVVRGGYGIFFHQTVGQGGLVGNGNDGFSAANTMVTTPDGGIHTGARLSDPFPQGLAKPTGSTFGLLTRVGQSLSEWDANFRTGYSQHYNFGLQRELAWFVIQAAFVGSRSVAIPIRVPLNQLAPGYLGMGNELLAQVANPFYGLIESGALFPPQVSRERLLRPFPQFDNISFYTPVGQDTYQSFQLKVERRFHEFRFLLGYTIAKSLTDVGGAGIFGFNQPSIQNYYSLRSERALSPIDVSQRFVTSFEWELPFTKRNRILGGWQFNGIATFQTGTPITLTTQVNQVNAFNSSSRPNVAPGASGKLPADQRSIDRWFNTSVFSQPPAFSFGNVARALPDVRNPGLENFDLSLFKNTRFTERLSFQLRFEAFNVLNHTNFGRPGTALGNAAFGVISTAGPSRALQVAAKIMF